MSLEDWPREDQSEDFPGRTAFEEGELICDTPDQPESPRTSQNEISRVFKNGVLELARREEFPSGAEVTLVLSTPVGAITIQGEEGREGIELISRWRVPGKDEKAAQSKIDDGAYKLETMQKEEKLTISAIVPEGNVVIGNNRTQIRGNVVISGKVVVNGVEITGGSAASGSIGLELRVPLSSIIEGATTGMGDVTIKQVKRPVVAESRSGNVTAEATGQAILKTNFGDIRISYITGGADVKTRSGNVVASEVEGDLKANSDYGDVKALKVFGDALLTTKSGNIEASGIDGSVDASTGFGDVVAATIKGRATLQTSSGDVTGTNIVVDATGISRYGDVKLTLVGGDVVAETSSGDVVVEDVGSNTKAESGFGDIRFKPGTSDIRIRAKTGFGDIIPRVSLTEVRERSDRRLDADLSHNPTHVAYLSTKIGDIKIV